jgi:low affinity Fe/Cu permease
MLRTLGHEAIEAAGGEEALDFGWSDTWQLVINTGTTIVTFLMVFVIQNTQNRDTQALQLKLDELIRATATARNSLMALEEKPQSEVEEIKSAFVERTS